MILGAVHACRIVPLGGLIFCILATTPPSQAAARCGQEPIATARVAALFGDVYNQFANDGEEDYPSYSASLEYQNAGTRVAINVRHSAYTTENAGPGTLTSFPTLDGGQSAVSFFEALETTTEVHVERCISRGISLGIAYVSTGTNYGYPHLRGLGIGFALRASSKRTIGPYASLYDYPAAQGTYAFSQSSKINKEPIPLTFSVITFDAGLAWHIQTMPISIVAGLYQELRYQHPYARPTLLIRASPYVGLELRLSPLKKRWISPANISEKRN